MSIKQTLIEKFGFDETTLSLTFDALDKEVPRNRISYVEEDDREYLCFMTSYIIDTDTYGYKIRVYNHEHAASILYTMIPANVLNVINKPLTNVQ